MTAGKRSASRECAERLARLEERVKYLNEEIENLHRAVKNLDMKLWGLVTGVILNVILLIVSLAH